MNRRTLDSLPKCWTCGGRDLHFSCGALFNGWTVFCGSCGCSGAMSKTDTSDYKNRHTYARKGAALKNWRNGLIERRAWKEPYKVELVDDPVGRLKTALTHGFTYSPSGSIW